MEFTRELPDIVVTEAPTEDEPIIFECELSRPSREPIKWTKNGKPMPGLPKHASVEQDKNGTVHRIVFTGMQEEDLGEYTILAEEVTSKGKIEMRSKLLRIYDII